MDPKTQRKGRWETASEDLSFAALLVPTPLTMMEKTKATMLTGYAGQKQETMVSHR